METRLNVRSSVRTYVWIAFPHVEQVANSVYSSECIHTARRSGHFGRNPGCGTLLSYSSSCLEPVYARQVSSQRPLNRPFQVLRACSTRARMCVCVCEHWAGRSERNTSLPPPTSQNGTEKFSCSFLSSFFVPFPRAFPFSLRIFRQPIG